MLKHLSFRNIMYYYQENDIKLVNSQFIDQLHFELNKDQNVITKVMSHLKKS